MQDIEITNTDIDIDSAWDNFLEDGNISDSNLENLDNIESTNNNIPKGTEIYISTKTK